MNHEKYQSRFRFNLVRLERFFMRAMIRWLPRWGPLENPQAGYSLVIGVACPLERILQTNLTLLVKQDRTHLSQVIVVCDRSREHIGWPFEQSMRDTFPDLPLRFVYWSKFQRKVVDLLRFSWIDSWLSWCLGISQVQTRYALLHDLDAMLLRPTILEERYQAIVAGEESFVGARFYQANELTTQDGFVVTFELIFDAQLIRQKLRPIDLFNHVCLYQGRRMELDTFLYAQTKVGSACMVPINSKDMVHPSQLFCQFNDLRRRHDYVLPEANNLPFIPYFLYLAGEPGVLSRHRSAFELAPDHHVEFFGMSMDASQLTSNHLTWLLEQVERLELAIAGEVRPEVEAYFQSIRNFVARTKARGEVNSSCPIAASM